VIDPSGSGGSGRGRGVIKLCMNGVRRGGRPNVEGLVGKRVADLLAADAEGVEAAAALFGLAAGALRRGGAAVVGWRAGTVPPCDWSRLVSRAGSR
jgi:hypothetical protein